ncbi:prepilin-type N-terminal cleavage/methylation domain-containing protein [Anaerocolumna xylanovorans]|uniref:Prepilin-type N-terminal cleavage/methylation domain-containing protein n=1 Tax=Anaerocolumna xylanovorans DSM 12503 TaxID=1121345 RepID=A0A1M7YMV3_9FIRM|nr:prepilin-type N-terminal cleavage/methylation domain-containing protein [Anaerocolumna xylanovorans]SHO53935.1 prepilin-type N-terminal cleavage/methylation domain-containing protein [Anaerocolumna xylanovorans DSM 12503]
MKRNRGITLIEIIIVIAILSVLTVMTFGGLNYIKYGNAKRCAYELNAALDKIRIEDMSKAEKSYLYIYLHGDSYYMKESTSGPSAGLLDNSGVLIGNRQLGIFYQTSADPAAEQEVGDFTSGNYMKVSFEKSTGELSSNGTDYYKNILIKDQDGTIRYTIRLIQASGKHFVK